jgi:hypothetical protein
VFPLKSIPKFKLGVLTLIEDVHTEELPLNVLISLNRFKGIPKSIKPSSEGSILSCIVIGEQPKILDTYKLVKQLPEPPENTIGDKSTV